MGMRWVPAHGKLGYWTVGDEGWLCLLYSASSGSSWDTSVAVGLDCKGLGHCRGIAWDPGLVGVASGSSNERAQCWGHLPWGSQDCVYKECADRELFT